eukprot:8853293-Pyramimonas_sp.AAC.1
MQIWGPAIARQGRSELPWTKAHSTEAPRETWGTPEAQGPLNSRPRFFSGRAAAPGGAPEERGPVWREVGAIMEKVFRRLLD